MLLLASGRGERFGGEIPKAYLPCKGRSLLERSLGRLAAIAPRNEREIILAIHPQDRETHLEPILAQLRADGLDLVVDGGATRQESMRNALNASDCEFPIVLIHDAARPFFPVAAAQQAIEKASITGGAFLAISAKDTLKQVDESGRVSTTLDRSSAWHAQTPQVVQRDLLEQALRRADADGFQATDDVSLLEHAGFPVTVVAGSDLNIKVTTPEDMAFAEVIATREDAR